MRDLRVAKGRFVLVGVVIGLIALLSTVLSGLASGLVDDGISGLRALPISHLTFQEGAESAFGRSVLTPEALEPFADTPGVDATPIGVSFFNAVSDDGHRMDIALFGIDLDGFLLQESDFDGGAPPSGDIDGGLVLSQDLAEDVSVGQELTIVGTDREVPVVGITYGGTYGHVPIAFTSLQTWQQLVYGQDTRDRFSAIALQVDDGVDLAGLDAAAGTETGTKEDAFQGSPGFSAETATMTLIRGFLLVISALVVGAFFTVWTVQRTRQIGLLKALGATSSYVIRDALGQLALVLVASVALGTLTGLALGQLVGDTVPFNLAPGSVLTTAVALVVVGLGGSLVALRRLTQIDPVISLSTEQ